MTFVITMNSIVPCAFCFELQAQSFDQSIVYLLISCTHCIVLTWSSPRSMQPHTFDGMYIPCCKMLAILLLVLKYLSVMTQCSPAPLSPCISQHLASKDQEYQKDLCDFVGRCRECLNPFFIFWLSFRLSRTYVIGIAFLLFSNQSPPNYWINLEIPKHFQASAPCQSMSRLG